MTAPPTARAERDAFRHPLRVYWEDTDAGGVVFYANYLKFFERARTEWLRTLGFSQQRLLQHDALMFVVAEATLRCHRAARLDDRLEVTVRPRQAGRASLRIAQQAWRDDELLADGEIRIGCVAARPGEGEHRACRIPAAILERLAA
jgi:acyl-CoA thioester hydrolase